MSASLSPDPSRAPAVAPPTDAGAALIEVRLCALTDVGRTREHNEDAFLAADLAADAPFEFGEGPAAAERTLRTDVGRRDGSLLLLVADGLGGAAAGELASRMAVREVHTAMLARLGAATGSELAFATALRDATQAANAAIHAYAATHAEVRGMGTTLTAAALRGDTLFLAQVGDSRAYLVRDGVARQLTKDQSLMQKLVEAGEITPEQAETSMRRNIILQALGPEAQVKVDLTHQQLRRGDVLLLCSDGLSGQVRAPELADAVAQCADLAALCRELVARANATGGPDNITVVAARFDGAGLAPSAGDDEVGHRRFPMGTPTPLTPIFGVEAVSAPDATSAAAAALAASGASPAASPVAAVGSEPGAVRAPQVGAPPEELAERRDRARVVYVGLAIVAVVLAAVVAWRFLLDG